MYRLLLNVFYSGQKNFLSNINMRKMRFKMKQKTQNTV